MKERKKRELDGIDREVLRVLYKNGELVSSRIAGLVGLSPAAIFPRLKNLEKKGIIIPSKISGERVFRRSFGNKKKTIKAPRSIYWKIDLKK